MEKILSAIKKLDIKMAFVFILAFGFAINGNTVAANKIIGDVDKSILDVINKTALYAIEIILFISIYWNLASKLTDSNFEKSMRKFYAHKYIKYIDNIFIWRVIISILLSTSNKQNIFSVFFMDLRNPFTVIIMYLITTQIIIACFKLLQESNEIS